MEEREDKKGKKITFITASCSTLCEYVRRQAEDAKEKVCVRWNATIKFDPTGYKFLYDFVERNVYQNRSQLYNIMKNVRKKKKRNNDGGGVRFRSDGKNIHAGMCVLWTSWKLHFILHFASPWVIRAYIYIKIRGDFWTREVVREHFR